MIQWEGPKARKGGYDGLFARNMKSMMALASGLGIVFTTVGLWLSYTWNLTSGATIILVSGVAYLLSLAVKPLFSRRNVQGTSWESG